MKDWFQINLGDAMLAPERQERIRVLALSAYAKAGNPDDMAAFTRHESDGRLHCEVKVYFSPGSYNVAKAVNALPCAKPLPHDLSMLAGTQKSWSILFPECKG